MSGSPMRPYNEAAAYLNISRALLERLVRERKGAYRKVGSRVFFTQEDLDSFIDATRVAPIEAAARPSARRAGRAGGPNLSVIGQRR